MAHQSIRTAFTLLRPVTVATATRLVVGLAAAVVAATTAAPAFASPQDPIPPRPNNWGYVFGAQQPGQSGAGGASQGTTGSQPASGSGSTSGPGSVPICGLWRLGIAACQPIPIPGNPNPAAPPQASPAQLAAQAWQQLPIPTPQVATAPPRGSDGLVGLSEWFWVTNWSQKTATVQAGAVWATVTAQPTNLTISPGGGLPSVSCAGPGTAYDPTRSADLQQSRCSYTYVRSSAGLPGSTYQVTVTVTWGGTWVGSGGAGGALPAVTRSTTFSLRVAEGQAVTGG